MELDQLLHLMRFIFVTKLPKTRSGKIMRRVLKAIAGNEKVGDVSTLEDSAVVKDVQKCVY